MFFKEKIFYCLCVGFLSACSVGPKYESPVTLTPSVWSEGASNVSSSRDKHVWWRNFHDPILNKLIEEDLSANFSIRLAQARVEAARAEFAVAYAQLYPKINADALPPTGTGVGLTQLLALSASLEPDFFGKQRENRRHMQANLEVEQAEQAFALLNLQAEVASAYLELREVQMRNRILNRNLNANTQLLGFLNSRYKSGFSTYLNIAQQKALIETQLAEKEQNEALLMMILHKIEMLTANNPGGLAKLLLSYRELPQMKASINLGLPSELLRRRPDIVAAERRIAVAHADIRIAIASLFPQITVGWLLGWQTQTIGANLFAMQSSSSTFLGAFNLPVLNLTLHRIVDLHKREKLIAVLQYQLTVMRALHEVQTQYNYSIHYQASAEHFAKAVKQKKLVLMLVKNTYQKGVADFNVVLRSEEDLNNLELSYWRQIVNYQIAQINLYKALGGNVSLSFGGELNG